MLLAPWVRACTKRMYMHVQAYKWCSIVLFGIFTLGSSLPSRNCTCIVLVPLLVGCPVWVTLVVCKSWKAMMDQGSGSQRTLNFLAHKNDSWLQVMNASTGCKLLLYCSLKYSQQLCPNSVAFTKSNKNYPLYGTVIHKIIWNQF